MNLYLRIWKQSFFRKPRNLFTLLILSWVAIWVTVFPLVHIHPEADHTHGGIHHHHSGVVHTVLSHDLSHDHGKIPHTPTHDPSFLGGVFDPVQTHVHFLNTAEIAYFALPFFSGVSFQKPLLDPQATLNPDAFKTLGVIVGWVSVLQENVSPFPLTDPYLSRPPPVLTILIFSCVQTLWLRARV